jgi:D-sedoheptulose 7-phosphate isomerase
MAEHRKVLVGVEAELFPAIELLGRQICDVMAAGSKLVVFGNGGSAADAQHLATELIGRFHAERRSLAAVALTTDSSVLTAIGNDYAFEEVFARQVEGLVLAGDLVVAISTSGESENVIRGLQAARRRGAATAALCGEGGRMAEFADHVIAVPSSATARIQESHILIIHLLCETIDDWARRTEGRVADSATEGS